MAANVRRYMMFLVPLVTQLGPWSASADALTPSGQCGQAHLVQLKQVAQTPDCTALNESVAEHAHIPVASKRTTLQNGAGPVTGFDFITRGCVEVRTFVQSIGEPCFRPKGRARKRGTWTCREKANNTLPPQSTRTKILVPHASALCMNRTFRLHVKTNTR